MNEMIKKNNWGIGLLLGVLLALSISTPSRGAGSAIVIDNVMSQFSGSQTNVPVTFGQIFKVGDVPKGTTVAAMINNQAIPLQVDVKASYPDGSLRHAVLTAQIPSLAGNSQQSLQLSTTASSAGATSITLSQLLATSYDAIASVTLNGAVYTVAARTLLEAAESAGQCAAWGTSCNIWLEGSLVSEWVVNGSVQSSDGTSNPNLRVYFAIRAYGGANPGEIAYVSTDIIFENTWAYTLPALLEYSATVTSGSASFSSETLSQYPYTRWHKVLWWNEQQPQVYVQQNTQYIQETGAISRYMALSPAESYLANLPQSCPPLQICDQEKAMGEEGAQDGIGPLPLWTTVYIENPDIRAYNNMLANTDGIGPYSVHYRDQATGWPVSIQRHPYITITNWGYANHAGYNGSSAIDKSYLADLLPPNCTNCNNPDSYDTAHQPSVAYVPYMVTGSYYYMSELALDASYNEIWSDPPARKYATGLIGNYAQPQPRGIAWTIRNVADAAYLLPDNYPLKAEFNEDINNNLTFFNTTYSNNPSANIFGVPQPFRDDGSQPWQMSPFMHAFLVWSFQHLADLGFSEAAAFVKWLGQYEIHVMTAWQQEPTGFCWTLAETYNLPVQTPSGDWLTYDEAYAQKWPTLKGLTCNSPQMAQALTAVGLPDKGYGPYQVGQMFDHAYANDGFPANLQIALAALVDAGVANAQSAWNIFQSRSVQPSGEDTYNDYPNFALLPRSATNEPIVNIFAKPNPMVSGKASIIYWDASAATSCSAPWMSNTETDGSLQVVTSGGNKTYSVGCTGSNGSSEASFTLYAVGNEPPSSSALSSSSGSGSKGNEGGSSSSSSGSGSGDPPSVPPNNGDPSSSNDPPPLGVLPPPSGALGSIAADCANLQTCTLTVETKGPFPDLDADGMGWSSGEYAQLSDGRSCILFLLGHTTDGNQNNSVRCFNAATDQFSYLLPNTENDQFAISGNGIAVRDNMTMLNVPNVGLLVFGGAYGNIMPSGTPWDGFLDYNLGQWTFINNIYKLFIPPSNFFTLDGSVEVASWSSMNPATAWSQARNVGFVYGGDNHAGDPSNALTLVQPNSNGDGLFSLESITPPPLGTMPCTLVRNNAVAVGNWAYVVGGRCDHATGGVYDENAFRRFNLQNQTWQTLAPLPHPRRMPVVTYDSHSGYIVVYGGNGLDQPTPNDQNQPGYWPAHNSVYLWNVATQGPWLDITEQANMPYIRNGAGAYDPTTGWHCYRPGNVYDANGNVISFTSATRSVSCMQLEFTSSK
ncbi:hypothetical conserved protein [Candidatus Nitrosoglobus terrae]|uniref:Hypothetical conserved protein n=2 Tax=Candidatus Nitrosoglobus terrae TaxID=1630141 RepID=A0A1Q2SL49_9GAMM|nr:hypothetical conserved protein [Candidatus Nitrosoglobus terrae]